MCLRNRDFCLENHEICLESHDVSFPGLIWFRYISFDVFGVTYWRESQPYCLVYIYEWVMSLVWMSQVTHMNESCRIHEWVMSRVNLSHIAFCHTLQHNATRCNTRESQPYGLLPDTLAKLSLQHTATHANLSHIACYRTHRRITRCLHIQARSRASRALMAHTPSQAGGHVWFTSFVNMHIHICMYTSTSYKCTSRILWSIHHASNIWRGHQYHTNPTAYSPLPPDSQYITNPIAFFCFVSWRDSESVTNPAAYSPLSPQDSSYITNPTALFFPKT